MTRLAPKRFLGTLVGMKFMINAAAGSLAAFIAELSGNSVSHIKKIPGNHFAYAHAFHKIAMGVFYISVLSLLLIPIVKMLIKGNKKAVH